METFLTGFPESVCVFEPDGTAKERVDLFILNHNSIRRALRWLVGFLIAACVLVTLAAGLAGRYWWAWIFLLSPSIILSPLCYALRSFVNEIYGPFLTSSLSALACVPSLIAAVIAIFAPGSPRVFLASALAFCVGSLVGNWIFQLVRQSQAIRGFEDNGKSFRARIYSSALIGRLVELLIFAPMAFAGRLDFLSMIWLTACLYGFGFAVELMISPITSIIRNRLIFQLSAKNDYIVDEPD